MKKIIYILIGLFAFGSYAQGGPKVDVIKFRGEVTTTIRDTFDVPVGETWLIWNESNNRLEIAQSNDVWKLLLTEDLFSWPNVWTGSSNTFETNVVIGEEGVYGGGLDLIGNIPVSGFNIQFYNNDYDTPLGIVGYNTTEGLKLENNTSSKSLKLLDSGLLTYNGQMTVSDDAYDAVDWNGNLEVPTKNAIRDKIESMGSGGTIDTSITDGSTNAVENNAIFDALALKADASSLSSYLLKSGGTMTGQINFGGYNTNNIGSLFLNNSVLPAVVTDASINANAGYNAIKSISSGFRFGLSENTNNFKLTFDSLTSTKTLNFTDSDVTWNGVSLVSGGGTDDQTAAEVPITDSGDYFAGTDVEAALQELGAGTAGGSFGIVAEGTFDTTSGTGTYTVTHSLGYAPAVTRIQIQQYDKPGCCANQPTSVENITTTTFDVKTTTTSGFYYAWRIFGTGSTTPLDYGEVANGLDTELGSSDWRTGGSGGLQLHPDSPVTIDSLYVGTVAQIAAAGLGTDVLSIPTDAKDYKYIQVPLSDLSTTLTTGTKKGMWIAPADGTIESPTNNGVAIWLDVPGTSTGINIDINKNGADIATTNLTTDATEESSDTAATDFVLSSYTFSRGDKFIFDIDAVPTGATGAQLILKVYYD